MYGGMTQAKSPPPKAEVVKVGLPPPKRSTATGELVFSDKKNFRPRLTPKEIMQAGSFGGTYFRPIFSSITGQVHKDAHLTHE